MKTYAYIRVSTENQRLSRQRTIIESAYPEIKDYIEEKYSGKTQDRPAWKKLLRKVQSGDTIVFEAADRMSRNAAEGVEEYMMLFDKGVNLVFVKQPEINTSVYREKLDAQKKAQSEKYGNTGNKSIDKLIEAIMDALHEYTVDIVADQIELAFQKAQEEREKIARRVKEGKAESKRKRLANPEKKEYQYNKGEKLETKKAKAAKEYIKIHSIDFGGNLTDAQCIDCAHISRNTFYKYKREIKAEIAAAEIEAAAAE